jgi:formamidopyrimidine-DNA glycosylase
MPELPEVETTLRGIEPHIEQQIITDFIVRNRKLRWPIPKNLEQILIGQTINKLSRRGKYMIFQCDNGHMLLHLGMSGRVRILLKNKPPLKHDHVDIYFANGKILRFTDPRRFGALLWTTENPLQHPLLTHLGPEPLTREFDGDYLFMRAKSRKLPVKSFIMDSKIVVGVGNIYAAEALYRARIHPEQAAGTISAEKYSELAAAIKSILQHAIKKGGTTLKDFSKSDGSPGYFSIELQVYGRAGKPCAQCQTELELIRIGQRSTVFCPACQPMID